MIALRDNASALGQTQMRRRRWLSHGVFVVIAALIPALVVLLLVAWLHTLIALLGRYPPREIEGLSLLIGVVLLYAMFFVAPTVVLIPFLMPLALGWRDPRRIVVFRRFNVSYENRQIRRIIRSCLASFGHVYTLADTRIHLPLSVRIPFLIGQLSWLHFRPRKITSPRRLERLVSNLDAPWKQSVNWFVSISKVFPIRCSDALWQDCVLALLDRADLIVVDISSPRESLDWEIIQACKRGLSERLIFVADQKAVEASIALARLAESESLLRSVKLYVYAKQGLEDAESFRVSVAEALARPRASAKPVRPLNVAAAVLGTYAAAVFTVLSAIVLASPSYFPTLATKYSPFARPVVFASLYSTPLHYLDDFDRKEAFARLSRDFANDATPLLIEHARRVDYYGELALVALCSFVGDARAIRPLMTRAIQKHGPWGIESAQDCLLEIVRRVGGERAALPVLEVAVADDREFSLSLVREIEPFLDTADIRILLSPWLDGDSQAASVASGIGFVAALLKFKAGNRDSWRTIASSLRRVQPSSKSVAAAAHLALKFADDGLLMELIRNEQKSSFWYVLQTVVETARGSNAELSRRAIASFSGYGVRYLEDRTRIWSGEEKGALSAAYVLASRHDPRSVAPVLHCFERHSMCSREGTEGLRDLALDVARLLTKNLSDSAEGNELQSLDGYAIEQQLGRLDGISYLVGLLKDAGEDATIRTVVAAFVNHPKARDDEDLRNIANALPSRVKDWLGESARAESNAHRSQLLRALHREIR